MFVLPRQYSFKGTIFHIYFWPLSEPPYIVHWFFLPTTVYMQDRLIYVSTSPISKFSSIEEHWNVFKKKKKNTGTFDIHFSAPGRCLTHGAADPHSAADPGHVRPRWPNTLPSLWGRYFVIYPYVKQQRCGFREASKAIGGDRRGVARSKGVRRLSRYSLRWAGFKLQVFGVLFLAHIYIHSLELSL